MTGNARLDVYHHGADSLQGRYHHYRLHPFSYREAIGDLALPSSEPGTELSIPAGGRREIVDSLLVYGGFPEPFLAQSARVLRRWQKERLERFFREDVRDLALIRDLGSLQLLADLLPERVGSPLSLNSLREGLEVSHRAVTQWIDLLDWLFYLVRVPPFTGSQARAVHKRSKAYLWDWSLVAEPGARLENLVALHLLKFCHLLEDVEGHSVGLHYLGDRDGHETDFLVTSGRKPWFAVEVELSTRGVDPSLTYFRDRLGVPWAYQLTLESGTDFIENGVRVISVDRFLGALA